MRPIGQALLASSPSGCWSRSALMCASMCLRAVSWHAILRAALPDALPRFADAMQGTSIGVLMSATLPARLGEPSRALIVARRLGRARERLPVVLGTLVSQTLLNVLALVILGAVMFTTIGLFAGRQQALIWYALAPFAVLVRGARRARAAALRPAVALGARAPLGSRRRARAPRACATAWSCSAAPRLGRRGDGRAARRVGAAVGRLLRAARRARPRRRGRPGRRRRRAVRGQRDRGAARHAVEPRRLPGRVRGGAHRRLRRPGAQALGYGIILQAVEIATAVVMGAPALVKEGVSWREVRLRALHTSPVSLGAAGRFLCGGGGSPRATISPRAARLPRARPRRERPGAPRAQRQHEPRQEPAVRRGQRRDAELRHRTSSSRRWRAGTPSRAPTRTACRSSTSRTRRRADRLDLRLRRHPGRRPGLPPGRRARPDVRRLRVRHLRRRHLDLLPRGAGARLRHAQGGRDGQERHVHRRRHRPAAPEDRRLRRGRPGLAQPVDPPERQLPLQLQLGPDHVDPAGDRGLRHLRPARRAKPSASSRSRRGPASAPSRTTSRSPTTASAPTRPRSRRA